MPMPTKAQLAAELGAARAQADALTSERTALAALVEAQRAITASLDPAESLRTIVDQAATIAGEVGAWLFELDEDGQFLQCRVATLMRPDEIAGLRFRVGEAFTGQVAALRQPLHVADIRGDPRLTRPEITARFGHVSYLGIPVTRGDRLLGVLAFLSAQERQYAPEEIRLLAAFADQAAIALENSRLYDSVRRELEERRRTEGALRESQERYRRLLDAVTDYTYQVRLLDGRAADTVHSPGCEQVTGYTAEELTQDRHLWLRMVDPLDRYAVEAHAKALLAGEVPPPLEHRIIRKDGARRWVRNTVVRLAEAQDAAMVFDGLVQDVTERKEAELALAEHAQRLETVRVVGVEIARELEPAAVLRLILARALALVGGSSGGIMLWDEEAGLLVPQAWLGYPEWFGGMRWHSGEGVVGAVAATRSGMVVNDYQGSPHAHPQLLARTTTAAVLAEPLLYWDRLLGVLFIGRETAGSPFGRQDRAILELLADQAAAAIETARLHSAATRKGEELEALLSAVRTVMAGLDLREILGRILEEAGRISGTPHVKVLLVDKASGMLRVGALQGSAMPPDSTMPLGVSLSGIVAKTGEPLYIADAARDPRNLYAETDQALGIVSYLGLPIQREGEVLGVLTFNTTAPRHYSREEMAYLTSFADQAALAIERAQFVAKLQGSYEDLQRTQDELVRGEKLRGLGQMAAGIAHELNNILAAILGQVELLKLRTADPALRETLDILDTAATDGAQVVRRLQDFARQQPHVHRMPVHVGQAVREALEITRPRWHDEALRRGVVVRVRTEVADPPPILGAAGEVREALTNLILNAVDAMPTGGELVISARCVSATEERSAVRRHDGTSEAEPPNGRTAEPPNIDEWVEIAVSDTGVGMEEAVRQRIFDPFFTTKGVNGTGLGLSVVYGIIERHEGAIRVASSPGQGTTVRLRFRPTDREALSEPSTAPRRAEPVTPRRILLIDDDPMVREALGSLLRAVGHVVTEAAGGAAGLAALAATPVDVVLTDLGMPEVTGWDVARAVKTGHPRVPVILLTGWGEHVEDGGSARGLVDRLLAKPIGVTELLAVIDELAGGE